MKKPSSHHQSLLKCYNDEIDNYEIATDEVGRGCLFGRVYAAAVILPKDDSFDHSKMKDSKKFTSSKKIQEVSEYIKSNAIAWSIQYEDENMIDMVNILQASQMAMHHSINTIIHDKSLVKNPMVKKPITILADGNYFKPFMLLNTEKNMLEQIPDICVVGGDNIYSSIAAASILAKVERDNYIKDMCVEHPYLVERYSLDSNKGYATQKHREGIMKYGVTDWHRNSFNCSWK